MKKCKGQDMIKIEIQEDPTCLHAYLILGELHEKGYTVTSVNPMPKDVTIGYAFGNTLANMRSHLKRQIRWRKIAKVKE